MCGRRKSRESVRDLRTTDDYSLRYTPWIYHTEFTVELLRHKMWIYCVQKRLGKNIKVFFVKNTKIWFKTNVYRTLNYCLDQGKYTVLKVVILITSLIILSFKIKLIILLKCLTLHFNTLPRLKFSLFVGTFINSIRVFQTIIYKRDFLHLLCTFISKILRLFLSPSINVLKVIILFKDSFHTNDNCIK